MPVDRLAVARGSPHAENQECQSKQADGAVLKVVVSMSRTCEASHKDHSDRTEGAQRDSELLGDHVHTSGNGIPPNHLHWLVDVGGRNVESDDSDGDRQPEKEGNNPVLGVRGAGTMQDQASNPPASEEKPDERREERSGSLQPHCLLCLWLLNFVARIGLRRGRRHATLLHVYHDVASLADTFIGCVTSIFRVHVVRSMRLRLNGIVAVRGGGDGLVLLGAQVVIGILLVCSFARGTCCHCVVSCRGRPMRSSAQMQLVATCEDAKYIGARERVRSVA